MVKLMEERRAFKYNRDRLAVQIPQVIVNKLDLKVRDKLTFLIDGNKIIITKEDIK